MFIFDLIQEKQKAPLAKSSGSVSFRNLTRNNFKVLTVWLAIIYTFIHISEENIIF